MIALIVLGVLAFMVENNFEPRIEWVMGVGLFIIIGIKERKRIKIIRVD